MSPRALRVAAATVAVLASAAVLLSMHPLSSTFALLNAETENAGSTFATNWAEAPTDASAAASGYDVALAWTPGGSPHVDGQKIVGVDNGTSSSCAGVTYEPIATLDAAAASYTDSNRGASIDGDWFCYGIVSTLSTWTAQTTVAAVQVGLAATALSVGNGTGTSGTLDAGDTITVTFNQRTSLSNGTVHVCVTDATTIAIGSSGCSTDIGTLTLAGATMDDTNSPDFNTSTLALSSSGPWTMTITLGTSGTDTSAVSGSPTSWTFTPSPGISSAATTDQASICTSGTNCEPTSSGDF